MNKFSFYFFLALTLCTFHQATAQSEFDAFEDNKDVTSVIVNKKMFEMMTNVKIDASSEEDKAYFNLIKKLETLKVFNTRNTAARKTLLATAQKFISNVNLKEMLTQNEDGYTVTFYANPEANKKEINQLLMVNEGNQQGETVVMYLSGSFSLNELATLTSKMKLPGTSTITRATK